MSSGVVAELQQRRPDQVDAVLDERDLDLEAMRQRDVVGVHPGHDVVRAGGHPLVEREPEADVRVEREQRGRRRASSRSSAAIARRARVGHRSVLHQHDVVGRPGLVVHDGPERRLEEGGVVAAHTLISRLNCSRHRSAVVGLRRRLPSRRRRSSAGACVDAVGEAATEPRRSRVAAVRRRRDRAGPAAQRRAAVERPSRPGCRPRERPNSQSLLRTSK